MRLRVLSRLAQPDYGCKVFGIEPSEEALRRCAEVPAIRILAGSAEEYFIERVSPGPSERFDVVLFRHSLENIVDPTQHPHGSA